MQRNSNASHKSRTQRWFNIWILDCERKHLTTNKIWENPNIIRKQNVHWKSTFYVSKYQSRTTKLNILE